MWPPDYGVPSLLPKDSWDRFQLPTLTDNEIINLFQTMHVEWTFFLYCKNNIVNYFFSAFCHCSRYELIQDVITSAGMFQVTVQLLNGTFPLPYNYSLSPEEAVVVEVSMNTSAEEIKVVIYSCWATPTQNPLDNQRFVFLDNR